MKVETERESPKIDLGRRTATVIKKRALVADDEPAMCVLIQEVLGAVDIEAVPSGESEELDRRIQTEKFEVALVGLSGPEADGIGLVRKIRNSGLNRMTPIILISSDQRPGALSRGFEAGATFFAYKPIDRAHLTRLIRVTQGAIEHEKRRFRRIPLQTKVRIKSDKAEIIGETIDISLNGALIKTPQTIPVGSLVEISLYLPAGARPVVGLGTVVRILNTNQMGILIDRLSAVEIGRLQEFLLPKIDELYSGSKNS